MSGMTKKVWGEAAGKGPYTGMPRVDILLKAIDKKTNKRVLYRKKCTKIYLLKKTTIMWRRRN